MRIQAIVCYGAISKPGEEKGEGLQTAQGFRTYVQSELSRHHFKAASLTRFCIRRIDA